MLILVKILTYQQENLVISLWLYLHHLEKVTDFQYALLLEY